MAEENDDKPVEIGAGVDANSGKPAEPAPSNQERAEAKAAAEKAEAEKAEAEKAAAEAAAKAAEEAAAGEDEEDDDKDKLDPKAELDIEKWGDYGETANAALALIQNAGGTPEQAKALLFDAVQAGDITKVDEAGLVELVGPAQAKLVMTGVKATIAEGEEKVKAVQAVVDEAAGSSDNWKAVAEWARKNVEASDLAEFQEMIGSGGRKAKYAANELVSMYNADPKNTSVGGSDALVPDGKGKEVVKGISAEEAGRQLNLAIKKGASIPEIKKILAAKRAGKKG